ncbi:MAG: hypothetical protein KDD47_19045, partial [Acidobacteria bacterium]|nr:hypothetical protein [Acidobacteriota bacterium]
MHEVLRWAVSDERDARFDWEALRDHGASSMDRDRFVADLWAAILHGPLQAFRKERLEPWGLEPAYRRRLFEWFLSRFHLLAALSLYLSRVKAWALVGALVAVPGGAAFAALRWVRDPQRAALLTLALTAACVAGLGLATKVPARAYFELLLPRLGVAVAIGYLFIGSSSELLGVLLSWDKG